MTFPFQSVSPFLPVLFGVGGLCSCVTMSGDYIVTAVNAQGGAIKETFLARGRHIYSARNGICAAHPGAVVTIRLKETGTELDGESPYRCR